MYLSFGTPLVVGATEGFPARSQIGTSEALKEHYDKPQQRTPRVSGYGHDGDVLSTRVSAHAVESKRRLKEKNHRVRKYARDTHLLLRVTRL